MTSYSQPQCVNQCDGECVNQCDGDCVNQCDGECVSEVGGTLCVPSEGSAFMLVYTCTCMHTMPTVCKAACGNMVYLPITDGTEWCLLGCFPHKHTNSSSFSM